MSIFGWYLKDIPDLEALPLSGSHFKLPLKLMASVGLATVSTKSSDVSSRSMKPPGSYFPITEVVDLS